MRTRFESGRVLLLVLAALIASVPARAQSTATVQGTVTDTQGAVMPGVTVTLHNTATGAERSVVTSSAGEFVAASLQPGHYAIVAHIESQAHLPPAPQVKKAPRQRKQRARKAS